MGYFLITENISNKKGGDEKVNYLFFELMK